MIKYAVYILRTSSNTLYIGQTNNLERRINEHKAKKGAKYIKYFDSFELVYYEEYNSRTESMRRENQLKGWSKAKKETLIQNKITDLKNLTRSTELVDVRTL